MSVPPSAHNMLDVTAEINARSAKTAGSIGNVTDAEQTERHPRYAHEVENNELDYAQRLEQRDSNSRRILLCDTDNCNNLHLYWWIKISH